MWGGILFKFNQRNAASQQDMLHLHGDKAGLRPLARHCCISLLASVLSLLSRMKRDQCQHMAAHLPLTVFLSSGSDGQCGPAHRRSPQAPWLTFRPASFSSTGWWKGKVQCVEISAGNTSADKDAARRLPQMVRGFIFHIKGEAIISFIRCN